MGKTLFQRDFWIKFLATGFFGSYLVPVIPGLYGVILGIGLALILNPLSIILKIIISIILILVSIPLCTRAEKILNQGIDPQKVVIDEVVGVQFASLWFNLGQKIILFHYAFPLWIILFLIYVFFDAVEPFPIKKIEKLPGGWGIVLDDIMAGIYTIASLIIILRIFG